MSGWIAVLRACVKNNFTELAPKFRLDLVAPIEQKHRNSITVSRILRLRRRQRWPEDGMRKCEVIFTQVLSQCRFKKRAFPKAKALLKTDIMGLPVFAAITEIFFRRWFSVEGAFGAIHKNIRNYFY